MLPGSFLSLRFGLRSWSFVRNYCYRGLGFVFAFNFSTNPKAVLWELGPCCVRWGTLLWWGLVWDLGLTLWTTPPLGIHSSLFGVPTWLLTVLCIFSQMSTSCEPLTVENVDRKARTEATLWTCPSPSLPPKTQVPTYCISRGLCALKPVGGCVRGCVYSKWGWELLKNIGNWGQKDALGWRRTSHIRDCGPQPCPWAHSPGSWCDGLWTPDEPFPLHLVLQPQWQPLFQAPTASSFCLLHPLLYLECLPTNPPSSPAQSAGRLTWEALLRTRWASSRSAPSHWLIWTAQSKRQCPWV